MAQTANKTCELCMRAPGLHYCTQCDQVFCDYCKIIHLRSKISRNHTFMTGPNINTEKKAGGCKEHNEDFIYLCEDCNQLICRLCVTKAHQKHYLVDIKDSNNKVQTEISKYLDSKVDNVRSSAKLIEGKAKTYKTEIDETVKVIIEHGHLIKAMVDKKVDALIKSLRERESIELQSLSKANTDCKDLLGEATRQQQIYQDMIKQCDEIALFHKMKKIKSDIDNLKTVDVTSLPSATYNRRNVNFSDVEKLFGNVTFKETEVAVKMTKLSAEPHQQPKQPKEEKKKDQPPVTKIQPSVQEQEMLQLRKDNEYYKEALDRARKEINDLRKSKDDALSRLSAMMGAKLRDNNPAITDLNDPNRPMKIGEQFSGVYENEWTDAFLNLQDMKSDVNDGACINEEEAIAILLNILRELNEKSILESDQQLSTLLQPVQGHSQDMSSEVTKSTKDTHKANAVKYIHVLYKKITCEDSQCKTVLKYTSHCQSYIEKCLKVCYFAAVQDPPMYLDFEPGEDTFDRQVYKEYTQMGKKVKFLVWPALFLHKGGALISKGVLQPITGTN